MLKKLAKFILYLSICSNIVAQNTLTHAELLEYIHQCSPHIADNTMLAIIKTESKGNYLDLGLNHGVHLAHQAKNLNQAKHWAHYLELHHYNFDIGLAQVNIINAHKYGFSAEEALEPCNNLKIAAAVLSQNYNHELRYNKNKHKALLEAISLYNTGNNLGGFYNGYVNHVVNNAMLVAKINNSP